MTSELENALNKNIDDPKIVFVQSVRLFKNFKKLALRCRNFLVIEQKCIFWRAGTKKPTIDIIHLAKWVFFSFVDQYF